MNDFLKYIIATVLTLLVLQKWSQDMENAIDKSNEYIIIEDYSNALLKANEAYQISINQGNLQETAKALSLIGYIHHLQGKKTTALSNYLEAENSFIKSDTLNEDFGNLLSSISILYVQNEKFILAEKYITRSILIHEEIGVTPENYSFLIASLADIFFTQSNYGIAEPLYIQSLQIIEQNSLPKDQQFLDIIIKLGKIYQENEDYELAQEVFVQANNKSNLLSQTQLIILNEGLGDCENSNGFFENASLFYNEALKLILDKDYSNNSKQRLIFKTAQAHFKSHNSFQAESALKQLIKYLENNKINNEIKVKSYLLLSKIYFENNNSRLTKYNLTKTVNSLNQLKGLQNQIIAQLYNEIGYLNYELGDLMDAKLSYEKSLSLYNTITKSSIYCSEVILNLGKTMLELGDLTSSENLLYPLLEEYDDENKLNLNYVILLQTLGDIYVEKSQFQKAEILFLESGEIQELISGKNSFDYALFLNRIGGFYYSIGDFERAALALINSLEITEKTKARISPEYSTALNNLALLFIELKEFDEAIIKLKESCEIDKKVLGSSHYSYAKGLYNLGNTYFLSGRLDLALQYIEESQKIFKTNFGESNISYNRSLAKASELELGLKKIPSHSIENLKKAIQVFESTYGEQNLETIQYKLVLAKSLQKENNISDVDKIYANTITSLDRNKSLFNSFFSESEKQNYFNKIQHLYDQYYTFLIQNINTKPEFAGVLFNQILKSKGLLLESSIAIRKKVNQSNNDDIKTLYSSLIATNKKIGENLSIAEEKRSESLEELYESARNIEKQLLSSLKIKKPSYDWKELYSKLDDESVIIEYLSIKNESKNEIYAAILHKNIEYPIIRFICESDELEKVLGIGNADLSKVDNIYGDLSTNNPLLYETIWKPTEDLLKNFKTIYYSPNGLLNRVAFHAIRDIKGKYLIQKYQLIHLYSSRSILGDLALNIPSNVNVMLFGGIVYDDFNEPGEGWNYLSGTKNEVTSLKSLLKSKYQTSFFVEQDASEENFKSKAENQQIIHMATHGFFFPDPKSISKEHLFAVEEVETIDFRGGSASKSNNFVSNEDPMMRSGLVLARANNLWSKSKITYKEDGLLTAHEVANLNLDKTKLVVLSACETGLGDISSSEGVYGLQRAFKLAGSQNLIITLWQIPDKESDDFMQLFYKNLTKTNNIRKAFYETQISFCEGKSPYYWGAFTLLE